MKRIHCLRYDSDQKLLNELLAEADRRRLRVGFLDLDRPSPKVSTHPSPEAWSKVVQVGESGTQIWKRRRGPWVFQDLLREHFRGYDLVLVQGVVDLPLLTADAGHWKLTFPQGILNLSSHQLLDRLSRISISPTPR